MACTLEQTFGDAAHFARGVELVTTRGTIEEAKALATRAFARELEGAMDIDWVSITDNAGGNPQLSPLSLGKPLLYAGKEVLVHLSCKDFNRNGLESSAWAMASEGFHNILALSGDYPVSGYKGSARPVFDIDSVALLRLLRDMNGGLGVRSPAGHGRNLGRTRFHVGAVTTNFKLHENEVMPQLYKLRAKIENGARFIIGQIGFDARKCSELPAWMQANGLGATPLIGNVFLMSARLARFFRTGRIAGVVVSDAFCELAGRHEGDRHFFLELAAKQAAIFRGLGYRGVYYGGVEKMHEVEEIIRIERSFAPDDWKTFARELRFSRPGEYFLYAEQGESGLADTSRPNGPGPQSASLGERTAYRFNRWVHDLAFVPGKPLFNLGRRLYEKSADPAQGPAPLRLVEHLSKTALFSCRDCGDCSLPDIAFLCPESACAKN